MKYTLRADISNHVVHLTRDRLVTGGVYNRGDGDVGTKAFDVLHEILISRKLNGSGSSGFISGTTKAVCFSEVPLELIPQLVKKSSPRRHRAYHPYGIAIPKDVCFALKGRPVIYLPADEAKSLIASEAELWRYVQFDLSNPKKPIDFTWEREWRVPGDSIDLRKVKTFSIVVETKNDMDRLIANLPDDHLGQLFFHVVGS